MVFFLKILNSQGGLLENTGPSTYASKINFNYLKKVNMYIPKIKTRG